LWGGHYSCFHHRCVTHLYRKALRSIVLLMQLVISVQVSLYVKGSGAATVQNMAAKKNFAKK
jgi:hypothetical protein